MGGSYQIPASSQADTDLTWSVPRSELSEETCWTEAPRRGPRIDWRKSPVRDGWQIRPAFLEPRNFGGTFLLIIDTVSMPLYPFSIMVVTVSLFSYYLFAGCVLHQKRSPGGQGLSHILELCFQNRGKCVAHTDCSVNVGRTHKWEKEGLKWCWTLGTGLCSLALLPWRPLFLQASMKRVRGIIFCYHFIKGCGLGFRMVMKFIFITWDQVGGLQAPPTWRSTQTALPLLSHTTPPQES